MVEAVGFDFDHTLGFDHRLERTVALDIGRSVARETGARFLDEDGTAFDTAIARYRNGGSMLAPELADYFRRSVPAASLDDAACEALVAEFRRDAVRRAPEFVRAAPGVAEMLAELSALGLPSAILTNGWSPLQEEKARLVGFDGVVLASDALGTRKPNAQAFEALADSLGCQPQRIAYVGDDPRVDVAGAVQAGMIAVWIDAEGTPYPADIAAPARRIAALSELVPWLQGQAALAAKPPP